MFGLFDKKSSVKESISFCASLAQRARIDVALEGGNYKVFIVTIDADAASLANHFKFSEARSAFVEDIEERIANRQYDDPCDGIDWLEKTRELTGWKANTNVVRAVIGRAGKPLFSWNPTTE